jgi:hypothetical protein
MLELQHDSQLTFTFDEVHPHAKVTIDFQRTLRIPDDDKKYPLPPGLGRFPLKHVDDFKDRVPSAWLKRGGIMLPLYQSEALWLNFTGHNVPDHGIYPFALKVSAGKVSALTGEAWRVGLEAGDYVTIPKQPWLDGYVIEKGIIRQFVAAPLGMGFTAEEQITGKAEFGGIQLEAIPMKREVFERRFPKQERLSRGIMRGMSLNFSADSDSLNEISEQEFGPCAAAADMGLAAGGQMRQEIYEDPFDINDWDMAHRSRVFVHLANSLAWKAITQHEPPYPPSTAADYARHGLPWFDHYSDDPKVLAGTGKLKNLKSVMQMGFQKGFSILPENESFEVKSDEIKVVGPAKRPNEVRGGEW